MKIIITEPELTQIVRSHVLSTVQMQNGSDIAIDFSATRGADGVTATIDIPYVGVSGLDLAPSNTTTPDAPAKPSPEKPKSAAQPKAVTVTPAAGIFAADGPGVASAEESADTSADAAEGTESEQAEAPAPTAAAASLFT